MGDRFQFKGSTATNWTSVDPVLAEREPGVETDTGKLKIGDGSSKWSELDYVNATAEHEWDGTSLRIRNPDGTWGSYVDLGENITSVTSSDNGDGTIDITFNFDIGGAQVITTPDINGRVVDVTKTDNVDGSIDLTFENSNGSTFTITTPVLGNNADTVDGYDLNQGVQTTDSPTFAGITFPQKVVLKSSNYTIITDDNTVEVNTSDGDVTITLPDLSSETGKSFTIRKIASANTVTINRAGTDTITRAGLTSVTLTSDGDFWTFFAGSTRWELVDGVESGSGSEYNYYKHYNGVLEQHLYPSTEYDSNLSRGNGYNSSPILISRIVDFDGNGEVTIGVNTSSQVVWANFNNISNGISGRLHSWESTTDITIQILATGRWYA